MSCRLFVVCAVLVASIVADASSLRALTCSNRDIVVGDAADMILGRCGEPLSRASRSESRVVVQSTPTGGTRRVTVTVLIDMWVYDLNEGRFLEELVFEDRVLVSVTRFGPR